MQQQLNSQNRPCVAANVSKRKREPSHRRHALTTPRRASRIAPRSSIPSGRLALLPHAAPLSLPLPRPRRPRSRPWGFSAAASPAHFRPIIGAGVLAPPPPPSPRRDQSGRDGRASSCHMGRRGREGRERGRSQRLSRRRRRDDRGNHDVEPSLREFLSTDLRIPFAKKRKKKKRTIRLDETTSMIRNQ